MGKYDDIINLPHHVSDYHRPMPIEKRAAQFAPFAALSGHDHAIRETARITEIKKELTEEEKYSISIKLTQAIKKARPVKITYFIPDKTKTGGSYKRVLGRIYKWDEYENTLILKDGLNIPIEFISEIEIRDYSQ